MLWTHHDGHNRKLSDRWAVQGSPDGFWGKLETDPDQDGRVRSWHPLADHCADVAACCHALLSGTLLGSRLAALAELDGLSPLQVQRLTVLAALHDVGKFNVGFQNKALPDVTPRAGHVQELVDIATSGYPEAAQLGAALRSEQLASWGDAEGAIEGLLLASVSHHGRPVQSHSNAAASLWRPVRGLDPFAGIADLVERTRLWFPAAWAPEGEPLPLSAELQHAFAGVVMLADWIGSDRRLFRFSEPGDPPRFEFALGAAQRALGLLGIDVPGASCALTEECLWPFEFEPNPMQSLARESAAPRGGSITVLEAETGSGKTEAALTLFLDLFRLGKVGGLYFALPTRTAATQIHRRITAAVRAAFRDEASRPPVVLAVPGYLRVDDVEGRALPRFEVLWNDDDAERFRFRGWAAERSKRFLAGQIVVGTIDQVLLSTLMVSHSHLRAAALLRHLLVVDEVHASDAYMTGVLQFVLQRHLASGGHALLMSATLGSDARERLIRPRFHCPPLALQEALATPYPAWNRVAGGEHEHRAFSVGIRKRVALHLLPLMDGPGSIAERALTYARSGVRVLVIRNTVSDCIRTQEAVERILLPEDGRLLLGCGGSSAPHHSRFSTEDRWLLDEAIESRFGRYGAAGGALAIATQTVQQSLDLDADVMLTDLCPADVLLQRLGRVHRHASRARPPGFEQAILEVLVPAERDVTPLIRTSGEARGPHGLGTVYSDLRVIEATLRVMENRTTLSIPEDCREIVERTTHPQALATLVDSLPEPWKVHATHIEGSTAAHRRLAFYNGVDWSREFGGFEFPSGDLARVIQTRLGEGDRRAVFPEPLSAGPFGTRVRELTIPAWLARGAPADCAPTDLVVSRGVVEFRFGDRWFVYDRLGLRPKPASEREDDDTADA